MEPPGQVTFIPRRKPSVESIATVRTTCSQYADTLPPQEGGSLAFDIQRIPDFRKARSGPFKTDIHHRPNHLHDFSGKLIHTNLIFIKALREK
jgi:hypothetical protein